MKISNRTQIHATFCIKFRNREHIACLYSALFLYGFFCCCCCCCCWYGTTGTTLSNFITVILCAFCFAYDWIRCLPFIIANMIGFCSSSFAVCDGIIKLQGHEVSLLFKCREEVLNHWMLLKIQGEKKKNYQQVTKSTVFLLR